jgi:hypothetical protein
MPPRWFLDGNPIQTLERLLKRLFLQQAVTTASGFRYRFFWCVSGLG